MGGNNQYIVKNAQTPKGGSNDALKKALSKHRTFRNSSQKQGDNIPVLSGLSDFDTRIDAAIKRSKEILMLHGRNPKTNIPDTATWKRGVPKTLDNNNLGIEKKLNFDGINNVTYGIDKESDGVDVSERSVINKPRATKASPGAKMKDLNEKYKAIPHHAYIGVHNLYNAQAIKNVKTGLDCTPKNKGIINKVLGLSPKNTQGR